MTRALILAPGARRLQVTLLSLLAAFLVSACTPSEERGGTYIEFDADSCAFTINLRMAFWSDGSNAAQVDGWTKAINEFWNGTDMKVGNCPLKVKAASQLVAGHGQCPKGFHCVEVKKIPAGTKHTSSVNLLCEPPL